MLTGILRVDGLQIDFEQLLLQLKKHEIVIKSFNNDWEYIENLKRQIESGILNENDSISACKNELVEAKKILQNRQEYDLIAKEILEYQNPRELLSVINGVDSEIQRILERIEEVEKRTEERHLACSHVLESIQILLETVGEDIKEFKQQ